MGTILKADEGEFRRLWSKDIDEYVEEDVGKMLEIVLKIKKEGEAKERRDLIEAYCFIAFCGAPKSIHYG